jgi:crotonobetainyl-CoA:carnitine CoA-transferase CaiB-like acyl-CoA transferase
MRKEIGNSSLPLSPYRVLNLADEKGAFCGKILADLGADVIKIEPPQGDPARNIGPFFHDEPGPNRSLFWFAYYTNQRSITLNLETVDGQRVFRELVKTSHFVLESFPPGYMDKLGLGYPSLSQINPSIIVTSITPFGQAGPYKDWKASDIVVAAMGGLMYLTGEPDQPPLRVGGCEQSYLVAGAYAAAGTMIAHYYRVLTGQGQHVDVSAQASTLFATQSYYQYQDLEGYSHRRSGNAYPQFGKRRQVIFPCKDGYISWGILLGVLGGYTRAMVDWMDSEGKAGELKNVRWTEFGFESENVSNEVLEHWQSLFGEFFKTHTKADFEREALTRRLMVFPVNTPKDLVENSQLAARNYWVKVGYPELGIVIDHAGPLYRSPEVVWATPHRAPLLGEHNEEIYCEELGFSKEEMCILRQANAI